MEKKPLYAFPQEIYGFIYHYYRAEIYRETNWRNRLDVTTNWALVISGGMLSYAFGNPQATHGIILINYIVVLFFLSIESRRYRFYAMLKERTRILEEYLFSHIFSADHAAMDQEHLEALSKSLRTPYISMSRIESIAWRLRRSYIFLLVFLYVIWLAWISQSTSGQEVGSLFDGAAVWKISGVVVSVLFFSINALLIGIAVYIPKNSPLDDLP